MHRVCCVISPGPWRTGAHFLVLNNATFAGSVLVESHDGPQTTWPVQQEEEEGWEKGRQERRKERKKEEINLLLYFLVPKQVLYSYTNIHNKVRFILVQNRILRCGCTIEGLASAFPGIADKNIHWRNSDLIDCATPQNLLYNLSNFSTSSVKFCAFFIWGTFADDLNEVTLGFNFLVAAETEELKGLSFAWLGVGTESWDFPFVWETLGKVLLWIFLSVISSMDASEGEFGVSWLWTLPLARCDELRGRAVGGFKIASCGALMLVVASTSSVNSTRGYVLPKLCKREKCKWWPYMIKWLPYRPECCKTPFRLAQPTWSPA